MNWRYRKKIEDLYLQMYALLFEYARSCLQSDDLAEEAVQETFRIACQKPEDLCESPNPHCWLFNTLKHKLQNMERSRISGVKCLQEYVTLRADEICSATDQRRLELLYGDLADTEEFQLVKEMAVDGMSHLQMAQKRGISVEACRKRVQRAKEALRKKIPQKN